MWLRDALAELARRLANTTVEWNDVRVLMASHLLALDKCPGVWPIGVGEVLRRILGKDVEQICKTDQLCSGLKSEIEGAVHTMQDLYEEKAGTGWGVLLVDTRNAFNSVNRGVTLWNARILWTRCS